MNKKDVLDAIGEAYEKSGCKPLGDWSASITLPGARTVATIAGSVTPLGSLNFITSAYPMLQKPK